MKCCNVQLQLEKIQHSDTHVSLQDLYKVVKQLLYGRSYIGAN